jgi:hypothetical protein
MVKLLYNMKERRYLLICGGGIYFWYDGHVFKMRK